MRIKSGVSTRAHKKKFFKLAKGNYSAKSTRWRMVKQQVEASLAESYIGRKDKKGDFRALWIQRINAAVREHGLTYSRFISGLAAAGIEIDRKVLSDIAIHEPEAFKALVEQANAALPALA